MTPQLLLSLLERAAHEELGLAVETNNPNYLYQQLINANRSRDLIITRPTTAGFIFIVKRTVELE